MPKYLLKPREQHVDLQICIPVYKRVNELLILANSIRDSLDGLNYNLYFLLNGASEDVKTLVLEKLSKFNNTGVIFFEENIKEDIFIWPLLNLPRGHFWIIGDDDFVLGNARDIVIKSLNNDLTILNYDLYDQNLENKVIENYLGRDFLSNNQDIDIKNLFSILGDKLCFISSVIVNSKILSFNSIDMAPKSFQYASLIYNSFAKYEMETRIFFEDQICFRQRGNNIPNDVKHLTDDIFINDIRFFYIRMLKEPVYRFSAFFKLIELTFVLIPKRLIVCRIEGRVSNVRTFTFIDYLYLFVVKNILRVVPVNFLIFLRDSRK